MAQLDRSIILWMASNFVSVYKTGDGYRASSICYSAHGKTKKEALLFWAEKARVKSWKEEEG